MKKEKDTYQNILHGSGFGICGSRCWMLISMSTKVGRARKWALFVYLQSGIKLCFCPLTRWTLLCLLGKLMRWAPLLTQQIELHEQCESIFLTFRMENTGNLTPRAPPLFLVHFSWAKQPLPRIVKHRVRFKEGEAVVMAPTAFFLFPWISLCTR